MINWRFLPWSACTHTNKLFISEKINKTKPTAVPTNVSVNCFRVRKHPLHQLQDIRETGEAAARLEASPGLLCCLCERRLQSGNPPLAQRAGPPGPHNSPGFGALPEKPNPVKLLKTKQLELMRSATCGLTLRTAWVPPLI